MLIPWSLARLVKNYHGLTVRQRITVLRRMVLVRERCAGLKKGLPLCCCNLAWRRSGGMIPWNVIVVCEMFKTSYQMGNTPCERRFGEAFEGPAIPFGLMMESHPISAKDRSRLHQHGNNVLFWTCIARGENFVKERFWSQTLTSLKMWTRQKSMLEDWMGSKVLRRKLVKTSCSQSQTETVKKFWRRSWNPEMSTFSAGPTRKGLPNTIAKHWRGQENKFYLGRVAGKPNRWLLEHWRRSKPVWTLDCFLAVHNIKWKTSWRMHVVREAADKQQP